MGEAIPGVNVQALTAFFSKHFEQSKTSTQPRQKIHKNKTFFKLLEFSSKPDLTTCKNSDSSSFCRSLSSFDLSNSGIASKCENSFKRKKHLNQTFIPATSSVLNGSINARAKLCQDNICSLDTTSNDSGVDCASKDLQWLQYDSGVEENSENSTFEDSRASDKHSFHSISNFSPVNGSTQSQSSLPDKDCSKTRQQQPQTINIVVKEPLLENNCVQSEVINSNRGNIITTVWNHTYEVDINAKIENNLVNKLPPDKLFYSEIVVSDNYVCKTQYRRTQLPSIEMLGPPPYKPKKPDNMRFSFLPSTSKSQSFQEQVLLPKAEGRPEGRNCFPMTQHINEPSNQSCTQEHSDNEFHPQTLSDTSMNSSHFHQQQKYYHESAEEQSKCEVAALPPPRLPPRRLSCPSYLSEKSASIPDIPGEELYQDATVEDENLYEEVPFPNDCQSHLYANHVKSNKMGKEIARLWQKNREHQKRELEKLKRKFGITGEEVPLEKGWIKKDAKGSHGDLAVKKGESVLILRIVDNPVGRLLVQNDRRKIGYVALDNLVVDADSIKTMMRERKHFMENKERTYSNSPSCTYAIYDEC